MWTRRKNKGLDSLTPVRLYVSPLEINAMESGYAYGLTKVSTLITRPMTSLPYQQHNNTHNNNIAHLNSIYIYPQNVRHCPPAPLLIVRVCAVSFPPTPAHGRVGEKVVARLSIGLAFLRQKVRHGALHIGGGE